MAVDCLARPVRVSKLKGLAISFAFVLMCFLPFVASAQQTNPDKVEINQSDTIEGEKPPKEKTASEDAVSIKDRINAADLAKSKPEDVDLAYGAYQRGYYLSAFGLALPRAQLGDPKAQTLIAELYDRGLGIARDPKEATAWYGIAAKNNDREAQFGYAVKLLEGKYVDKNPAEAKRLMKLAADSGHATAAFNYGQILIDERPTSGGVKDAFPYFEAAADQRIADAYYALSQIYRSGKLNGYPENDKAQEWLIKAAQAGVDTAQVDLGIWLANGTGGSKDEKAAFAWMSRAANGGNVIARNRLAIMYARGIGTNPNPAEAAKWYILAKRAGLNDGWLDDFIKTIDRGMLAKALEAANRWPSG
jgi:TPR repeat protein